MHAGTQVKHGGRNKMKERYDNGEFFRVTDVQYVKEIKAMFAPVMVDYRTLS